MLIRDHSCKASLAQLDENSVALVGRREAALTLADQFDAGCLVDISGCEAYPGGIILVQQSPPVPFLAWGVQPRAGPLFFLIPLTHGTPAGKRFDFFFRRPRSNHPRLQVSTGFNGKPGAEPRVTLCNTKG